MNASQINQQLDLALKLGRLVNERVQYGIGGGPIANDLDRRIELGSKALYDFHASIIQPSKPKAARKRKGVAE